MFTVGVEHDVVPPGPVQDMLNVCAEVSEALCSDPEMPRDPGAFHGPEPVEQPVVFEEFQVSVVGALYCTGFGDAVSEQVGAGAFTVTLHVALWPPEVTVTVLVPVVDQFVVNEEPLPVAGVPPPDQANVPLPAPAFMVAFWPIFTVCEAGEQVGAGVE